jgi:hypothetical protein
LSLNSRCGTCGMRAGVSLSLTPGDMVAHQIVDLDHALAKLGRAIDWRSLEERRVRL